MTYPAPGGQPDPSRRSRTPLYLAGGFIALVVICLVIVLVSSTGSDDQPGGPAGPPPAARDAGEVDQTVPTTAPPGATWTYFRSVALPQSHTYGPTQVNGDVAAGYEHSPTGALFAAVNITTRYSFGLGWREVLDRQTAPGPGRKAWIAIRTQHPLDPNAQPAPGSYGQFAGFRFVNYSPEMATVQVVTQFANYGGALQMSTLTVQWSGQDWVLVLQPDGSPSPSVAKVPSLDQFVSWGPS